MKTGLWPDRAAAADPIYRRRLTRELLARRRPPPGEDPNSPGHIVEFWRKGTYACGVLIRRGRPWDEILDVRGSQDRVDHGRIVDRSSAALPIDRPRHHTARALREVDRERDRLSAIVDCHELWEAARSEEREWTLDELTNLWFPGDPGPHGKAAVFRALSDGRVFRRRGTVFVPLPAEKVAGHRAREDGALRTDAWLRQAATWLRHMADGRDATPPPDAARAAELLAAKALFGEDHPDAEQASALAKLASFRTRSAMFRALVNAGHWDRDENLDVLRHRVPVEFAEDVRAEAEGLLLQLEGRCPRLWFRRVYAFADEGEGALRAFSIRRGLFGFTVGIHFASPALVVQPGSAVHAAAEDRAAAIRLPNRTIPMLPERVLEKVALAEDELRPALTLDLHFSRRFELRSHEFGVRRVRVNRLCPQDQAEGRAERDWGLRMLRELARKLRRERVAAGAVVLPEPHTRVRREADHVSLQRIPADHPSRLIDEELCTLAGVLTGRLCAEQGLPAVYRVSDACSEILADPYDYDAVQCFRQRRDLPKEHLQIEPAPHHTLGAEGLVPLDRPFSRFPDLLVHQQIMASMAGRAAPHDAADLGRALLYGLHARTIARDIERGALRYWLIRYLEQHVGDEIEAVVLHPVRGGYRVELTETRLWTDCRAMPGVDLRPGAMVYVRVTSADARAETIGLELARS